MDKQKIKVGIIGCGFVGGALKAWLEEKTQLIVEQNKNIEQI